MFIIPRLVRRTSPFEPRWARYEFTLDSSSLITPVINPRQILDYFHNKFHTFKPVEANGTTSEGMSRVNKLS